MLDFQDVSWDKVLRRCDPGREGSGEQRSLKDIQRKVRSGVRCTVPLGDVLGLPGAAVSTQTDAVPKVWLCGGLC